MKLTFSTKDEAFRTELLEFIDAHCPPEALARRGHEVVVFCNCEAEVEVAGVKYRPIEAFSANAFEMVYDAFIIVRHLAARRSGAADAEEPTGLLTHHLQTDAPGWAFLEELMDRTAQQRCARWIGLESLMGA